MPSASQTRTQGPRPQLAPSTLETVLARSSGSAPSAARSATSRSAYVFLGGLAVAIAGCGASCKKSPEATPAATESSIAELPGVDTGGLVAPEKQQFTRLVRGISAPCGDPVNLERCVLEKRTCASCLPAARAVAKGIGKGESDKAIQDWVYARYDQNAIKSVPIADSPFLGPEAAPVVVVEFADFQCPYCGQLSPLAKAALTEGPFLGKVRFVFKHYPLPMHDHAEDASRGAVAALQQGKFWPMLEHLFTHQEQLGPSDLEGAARTLGLDVERWRKAYEAPETRKRVEADRADGRALGVDATPTFFINGRRFVSLGHEAFLEQLKDWVAEELNARVGAAAAPSASR